jgi:organic hydroperoxide reductase OsmC/OhrA
MSHTHTHTYRATLSWEGSTAAGYDAFDRAHRVAVPPAAAPLDLSGDPAFKGDPDRANPEQLLLAAASSCQLLSFLAESARAGVDVLAYEDDAEAFMPEDQSPVRIAKIVLRPQILVGVDADLEEVRRLVAQAHDTCYVANTLNAEIVLEPAVDHAAPSESHRATRSAG